MFLFTFILLLGYVRNLNLLLTFGQTQMMVMTTTSPSSLEAREKRQKAVMCWQTHNTKILNYANDDSSSRGGRRSDIR